MATLQGDPYNLQGSNPTLQGGSVATVLQPSASPTPVYGPTAPAPKPAPVAAPAPAQKPIAAPSVVFYKPDPNSPQVYDANGTPLSYEQYIAAGGRADFKNVLNQAIPGKQVQTIQQPTYQQSSYSPVPTAAPAPTDPNQALAQSAAQAGLSLDDYLKLSSPSVSPEEKQRIYDSLGIGQLENQIFTPPSKTTEQLYQDAYAQAGLTEVKIKIQTLIDQINKAQSDFNDASGVVNENPFLSEASRVGRVSRLNDKAQAQIGNLTNQLSQLQDLYNNGVGEVNNVVSRTTADFQSNQALNAQKLQYLLQKAEQQVGDLQSSKASTAYQYLPDYLKAKAAAQKPDTIGSAESGYYRWNPNTGTFEQVIAPNVTPNFQANPLTGELFNTKTGLSQGGSSGGSVGGSVSIPQNTLAFRNNNPGNLRFAGQAGATQGEGGFARFSTPEAGYQALIAQIQLDSSRGATLSSFINKYAPPSENNTAQYIQQAISATGASANTPLSQIDINTLAQFMAKKESGTTISTQSGGVIDNLVQQVINNPALLTQLPDVQQKAVVARMAQLGISIPNTKQPTDAQNSAAGYATRVQQSGTILDQLQASIAGYNILGFKAEEAAPNNLKSSAIQQYDQAARNFINAILRRESGAAIAQSEFDNAYQQYLPYPGDSAQVLAQKKQNRDTVLNSLKQAAGPAYTSSSSSSNNDPLGLGI